MKKLLKRIIKDKMNIFLIVSLTGTLLFGVWILISNSSKPFEWLVMEHNFNWQFSDFFRQIVYSSDLKNIYFNTNDAPFPPLAYLFFHLIYRINPTDYVIDIRETGKAMSYQYNLLIFLMIELVNIIFLFYIIRKFLKKYGDKKILLFMIALLFSAPFLAGAIERGNPALMTLTLVLYALYFKDSKSKIKRQVSLVLLAISVALKLYPAILIVLWIKEKRYSEIKWFIAYCLLLVILPFAFTGGANGFFKYCDNLLTNFSWKNFKLWTSIEPFCYSICSSLNLAYNAVIPIIIKYIFLVVGILYALFTKEKHKALIPLSTLMAVFVTISHRYVSIYLLIPLLYYLSNEEKGSKPIDTLYIILFGLIFTIPMWACTIEVDFAIFIVIYLLNIVVFGEGLYKFINKKQWKILDCVVDNNKKK